MDTGQGPLFSFLSLSVLGHRPTHPLLLHHPSCSVLDEGSSAQGCILHGVPWLRDHQSRNLFILPVRKMRLRGETVVSELIQSQSS